MDKRALAEQLLGLPPGALLDFKDYGDHVALILPDGRKLTLSQARLDAFAHSQAAIQAAPQTSEIPGTQLPEPEPPTPRPASGPRSRRPRRSFSGRKPSGSG